MYNDLVELTTILGLVSVATERVVEMLKPWIPKQENVKYTTTFYSLLAYIISLLILSINNVQVPFLSNYVYVQNITLALACTAGSGFWNDTLKVLQGFKIKT